MWLGALTRMLKEHRLASRFGGDDDFVFSTGAGGPFDGRNFAQRGPGPALARAGVDHLRVHHLRHCAASMWIAAGNDITYVSRQLGHADPGVTLKVYSHPFDHERHAERTRALLEDAYGDSFAASR